MFGTLQCSLPRKEPLTFVENMDQASALSRTRCDKPHTSCMLCRKRKIRCNGRPSGCDKCVAVSAYCRYPGRESRRGKRPTSREIGNSGPKSSESSTSSGSSPGVECKELGQGQGPEHGQGDGQGDGKRQEQRQSDRGQVDMWPQAQTANASVNMFDLEAESDYGQQMKRRLLSPLLDGGSSGGSVRGGLDNRMDLDSFANTILTEQPGNAHNGAEMTDDAMEASLYGGSASLNSKAFLDFDDFDDFDDFNTATSFSSGFPSSDSLTKLAIPSSYNEVSPLTMTMPSTHTQRPAPDSNNTQRDQSSQAPDFGRWPRQSPANSNNLSRTSGQLDRRQPGPMSEARMMSSETPAATGASLPNLMGQERTKNRCRCLHSTARLLEELGARAVSSEPVALDVLLSCLRGALVHCAATLDCELCISLSENNMLLAMAGGYMSTICKRIVMSYSALLWAQKQEQNQRQWSKSSPGALGSAGGAVSSENGGTKGERNDLNGDKGASTAPDEMWFSTYRIESTCERMQVLRCLVTVQLAEFSRLLDKLKARAGSRRGHLLPLTEAERRMRTARLMLSSQHPHSI